MDGVAVGWMDRWMGVFFIGGWMDVCMDAWMDVWMDGRIDGLMNGQIYG